MDNIVEIKDLTKKYKKKKALDNFSLNIKKGRILGILGPNGSGKTTLIKSLVGLIRPSGGNIRIDGMSPGVETKKIVSYLPDRNFLYRWMDIEDAINFYEDFYEDFNREKALSLLGFMDLDTVMKIDELSKGMLEKLNLTLVLSREAKIYVLDEPIAGVDPVARDQILDAIIESYSEDSTMIITTHLVRDMERIFEDLVFIKDGKVELEASAEDLREKHHMQIDDLYKKIFIEEEV